MVVTNGANGTKQVRDEQGRIVANLPAAAPPPQVPRRPPHGPAAPVGEVEGAPPALGIGAAHSVIVGRGQREGVLSHPGTGILTALVMEENPGMEEALIAGAVEELYGEAVAAGLEDDPSPASGVYSWIDAQMFYVLSRFPADEQEPLLEVLRGMAVEYSEQRNNYITPAHIYAWKHAGHVARAKFDRESNPEAKTIAVDVDGVLYDVDAVMWRWLTNKGYAPPVHEVRTYDMSENWGIDGDVIQQEFGRAVSAGVMFRHGEPYAEGLEAVRRIYGAGHEVVLITARDLPGREQQCLQATIKWLREQRIPFDALHLTREKEKVPFDVLVDDAPGNVERVTAWGKSGIILHRPWNRDEGQGYARGTWMDVLNTLGLVPAVSRGRGKGTGTFEPSNVAREQTLVAVDPQARGRRVTTA